MTNLLFVILFIDLKHLFLSDYASEATTYASEATTHASEATTHASEATFTPLFLLIFLGSAKVTFRLMIRFLFCITFSSKLEKRYKYNHDDQGPKSYL